MHAYSEMVANRENDPQPRITLRFVLVAKRSRIEIKNCLKHAQLCGEVSIINHGQTLAVANPIKNHPTYTRFCNLGGVHKESSFLPSGNLT
jgi:hypothetical protein